MSMQPEALDLAADEQQKKRVSRRVMWATAGGRFMAALTAALLLVAAACPAAVGGWMRGEGAESIGLSQAEGLQWALAFFFLIMAFMCAAIWFRQRNRRCAMRHEERVHVDESRLLYRYTEELGRADAAQEGFGQGLLGTEFDRMVRIDLTRVSITYDRSLAEWVFKGDQGSILSVDRAHPDGTEVSEFRLGDYFEPELGGILQRRARW